MDPTRPITELDSADPATETSTTTPYLIGENGSPIAERRPRPFASDWTECPDLLFAPEDIGRHPEDLANLAIKVFTARRRSPLEANWYMVEDPAMVCVNPSAITKQIHVFMHFQEPDRMILLGWLASSGLLHEGSYRHGQLWITQTRLHDPIEIIGLVMG